MNCCDRILILFITFVITQYSFRWQRDADKVSRWRVLVSGTAKARERLEFHTVNISYGDPVLVLEDGIVAGPNMRLSMYANVSGPPKAYHRIAVDSESVSTVASELGDAALFFAVSGESFFVKYTDGDVADVRFVLEGI